MSFDLDAWLKERALEVEAWLFAFSSSLEADKGHAPRVPQALFAAMSYSLLGGGKRLRPALAIASALAVGESKAGAPGRRPALLRDACCAVELVHNYSLIHDDLPAMDDDDLRRGRPTCHKVHGEAMAILAGDGLLTDAFGILSHGLEPGDEEDEPDEVLRARLRLVSRLSLAAGSAGMVGGQALDIARTAVGQGLLEVERVHSQKTGAIISFACAAGAESVGASPDVVERLAHFGRIIGLGFQIADDILDEIGDASRLGKAVHKDRERDTATVTRAIGLEAARVRAHGLVDLALSLLADLDEGADALRAVAGRLVERSS